MRGLREICDAAGWLLIADEIYTGLGRTGTVFACDHEAVVPDLLCVGKGLASGMPLSACVGLERVFEAWPRSLGEALHTQTFLGHPASCAAAIASLSVSKREDLPRRARDLGAEILRDLRARVGSMAAVREVRGLGLMIGVECARPAIALATTRAMLEAGYVLLPSGDGGRVLSLTPPLTIGRQAIRDACEILASCLERASSADCDEDRESAAGQGSP
jgi:acetylornithine/succinyldiaminopimelate/putrescine aminotransferase